MFARSSLPLLAVAAWLILVPGPLRAQKDALAAPPDPARWRLVWSDEFNGSAIDDKKWHFEINGKGGGNDELQYYTKRPANAAIQDGRLVITALKEDYNGPDGHRDYTSARLVTQGAGDWKYGRFEARLKLPKGKGVWPAFWMMPTENVYGTWPLSGEIDIMEVIGQEPNVQHGTLHYGDPWPKNVHTGGEIKLPEGDFSDAFHVFAVEWEPAAFRWYLDGKLFHTETKWWAAGAAFPAPFDEKFFLILNVAVGGAWPGPPDDKTVFPQRLEVDYVRVYQSQ